MASDDNKTTPARKTVKMEDRILGDGIEYHSLPTIVLPDDKPASKIIEILQAKQEEQETVSGFTKAFNYRMKDGAVAASVVLKSMFGVSVGMETRTMFGKNPPQLIEVEVGPNETIQVPWGKIRIPQLGDAELYLGGTHSDDYGQIFVVQVMAKRLYSKQIKLFFSEIEEQLRTSSIYRGKAVCGADELKFIGDLEKFDSNKIVFASGIRQQLDAAMFSVLRHPHTYRNEGIPLKRAVLLYGPYGTGKTSIGMMLAKEAQANGWTFLMARPGKDRVEDVLTTARLYAPSVVWVEDIDTDTGDADPKAVSRMLDAFDGVTTKAGEIMICMSSNHIERVPSGMLRPGRLDYVLKIAELDRIGVEQLIRVIVDERKLADDIDFDAVYHQMIKPQAAAPFLPAFVRATADRARGFAISRLGGDGDYVLNTEDLVNAARSLHPQQELHVNANDPKPLPTLDRAFREAVTAGGEKLEMLDYDGDKMGNLRRAPVPARNGSN